MCGSSVPGLADLLFDPPARPVRAFSSSASERNFRDGLHCRSPITLVSVSRPVTPQFMLTFTSVGSLYVRLGPGSLSGQLFADICDQLLLSEAQDQKIRFTPHSDRAGDYLGLDSYSDGEPNFDGLRGRAGFQYKFFPSESGALSARHKDEIIKSIKDAKQIDALNRLDREKKNPPPLACWILVTPEDFNKHQLAWYLSLESKLKCPFKLRQWGQKQLARLMTRHPNTVAHLYPDIVPSGPRTDWRRYCIQLLGELSGRGPHKDAFIRLALSDGRDAQEALRNFLSPESNHVLFCLLGSYGAGKSTVLERYTRDLAEDFLARRGSSVPLLIQLRYVRGQGPFRKKILEYLHAEYGLQIDLMTLKAMIASREVVVILDGLDEKEEGVERNHALVRLREVFDLLAPPGKLVVSSRTEYFVDAVEEQVAIVGRYRAVALQMRDTRVYSSDPKVDIAYLSLLSPAQVREHVLTRADDGEELLRKIASIYDLRDLVRRPVLLDMICKTVPLVDVTDGPIPRVTLYDLYTRQQLDGDVLARGITVPATERIRAIEDLAEHMVVSGSVRVHHGEIAGRLPTIGTETRDFLSTSFLIRDPTGMYEFSHLSFLEYFSARRMLATLLGENPANQLWRHVASRSGEADHSGGLSHETFRFLLELLELRMRLIRKSGRAARRHRVDLLPVTIDQFQRFMESTGRQPKRIINVLGFAGVAWTDAQAFATWSGASLASHDDLRNAIDSEWPHEMDDNPRSIHANSPTAPMCLSDSGFIAVRSYREWLQNKYVLCFERHGIPGRYSPTLPAPAVGTAVFRCRRA